MAVANVLEWVQCKSCGRRHRWKAELVGTEIQCSCGAGVPVPAPDAEDAKAGTGFDPEDTLVDPSLTNDAAAIAEAPPELGDDGGLGLEEEARRRQAAREHQKKLRTKAKIEKFGDRQVITYVGKKPLFGMTRTQEMIFWLSAVALAFALVVHALVVQTRWYIIATVIIAPLALLKFIPTYRRWRGNRSFKRAWAESFASDAAGEEHHDTPG